MEVTISPLSLRPDLLETVCHWHHQEWGALTKTPITKRHQELSRHLQDDSIPHTWVALINNTGVGCVSLVRKENQSQHIHMLSNLWVQEEFRQRGIGAQLCRVAEAAATKANIAHLWLITHDRENYYLNLGWTTEKSVLAFDRPAVAMRKAMVINN